MVQCVNISTRLSSSFTHQSPYTPWYPLGKLALDLVCVQCRRKITCPWLGSLPRFLSCPAHSLLLYYLGYPSSQHTSNITDLLLATSSNHLHKLAMFPFAGCSVGTCCNWYRWTLYIWRHKCVSLPICTRWLQLHPLSTVLAKVSQFHYETHLKTFFTYTVWCRNFCWKRLAL
jgi:hypothetical protein